MSLEEQSTWASVFVKGQNEMLRKRGKINQSKGEKTQKLENDNFLLD